MENNNYCSYCNKHFRFYDLYFQHTISCDFFRKSKKTKDREVDCNEKVPSPQEMFKYIQFLAVKCDKLQQEVENLKKTSGLRCKKIITQTLETLPKPVVAFETWIRSFVIPTALLDKVCKEITLIEGVKQYLGKRIRQETVEQIPIRSFKQKPNNLYVYSSVVGDGSSTITGWRVTTPKDMSQLIDGVFQAFIVEFTKWQDERQELFETNEREQDKNIKYMMKIHNIHGNQTRQITELRRWLYSQLLFDLGDGEK
jgi:hypothetical protein